MCYRAAKTGIITGVLLAIALSGRDRAAVFTALSNEFMSLNMNAPSGRPAGQSSRVRRQPLQRLNLVSR